MNSTPYKCYIFADDLKLEVSDISWAGASEGDELYIGTMQIAYVPEGSVPLQ